MDGFENAFQVSLPACRSKYGQTVTDIEDILKS